VVGCKKKKKMIVWLVGKEVEKQRKEKELKNEKKMSK
jgi:hypothetical protein